MHKSYFHGTPNDYIQVVSHKDQDQKLKALGFVECVDDLADNSGVLVEAPQAETSQINLRQAIDECQDKGEVEALVMSTTGIDVDKRGSLDHVKAKALAAVQDHLSEQESER